MKTTANLIFLAMLLWIGFGVARPLTAQTASATPAPINSPVLTPSPTPAAVATPPSPPKVIAIEGNLELDDIIRVEVDHLNEWVMNPKNDPSKLVPYLNGLAIRGNYP